MNDTQVKLCTLYQKTSENGNTYFFGRMGNTKVALFFDKKASEALQDENPNADPLWNLVIQECDWKPDAPKAKPKPAVPAVVTSGKSKSGPKALAAAKKALQESYVPFEGDELPPEFRA